MLEDLGLAKPEPRRWADRIIVSSYRVLGFAILALIAVTLVSYLATSLF